MALPVSQESRLPSAVVVVAIVDVGAYDADRRAQLPSGAAFLGAPPERLFSRCGEWVASEAVAGTRPRDPANNEARDAELAFEMLLNPKEHQEFTIVRNSVQSALGTVCQGEVLLEMEKAVLKQARRAPGGRGSHSRSVMSLTWRISKGAP